MKPYRFNKFEMDLLQRLTFNVYLKNQHFTMNRWPLIYWGDDFNNRASRERYRDSRESELQDDRGYRKFDIDLLGCYISTRKQEGYIEIYSDKIADCANDISIELELDYELTRSLLQTIVLLHEIGHWFSHCCFKSNREHRMYIFSHQTTEIKETIAQLSVIWATLGLRNKNTNALREIMDFLTKNQSSPYRQYLKLGERYTKKSTILNRYVQLQDKENSDLNYLLMINKKMDSIRKF